MAKYLALFTGLVMLALMWGAAALAQDDEWRYVHESEGVEVYERDARELGGLAFRGVYETDIHIGQVISVFVDAHQLEHWVYRFAEYELIERDTPNRVWSERLWVRVDMPFPTTDRDYVFHSEYEIHPENQTVTAHIYTVEDERVPERDCCIRAESITRYVVQALPGEERTRIEVEVEVDLKGRLPGWITEGTQREWPVETLTNLVERAREAEIDDRVRDWHDGRS